MEPEVDTNMKKCITYALTPKRVSDPAYGKDWLIDWLIDWWDGIFVEMFYFVHKNLDDIRF